MRTAILIGFGNIGYCAALDLADSGFDLTVIDKSEKRLKIASRRFGFETLRLNVLKHTSNDVLKRFRYAVTSLPGSVAFKVLMRLVDLGVNVVDVSYFPEDPYKLSDLALRRKVKIVIDAGFAPGLSNILLGKFSQKYGGLKVGRIYVGGLSMDPNIPLGLVLTWSAEDLIDEYVRPARIILNGKQLSVDPLSMVGRIEIPKLGLMEYFVSDGVRTMLKTFNDAVELVEYTLRYPGHINVMMTLKNLGFLSEASFKVNGYEISAKRITSKILENHLTKDQPDRVVMYLEAISKRDVFKKFILDVPFDDKLNIHAMGKVTGFTLSSIFKLMVDGLISDNGLIVPERLGMDKCFFNVFNNILRDKGIMVSELDGDVAI